MGFLFKCKKYKQKVGREGKKDNILQRKIHYAWFICASATLLLFATVGMLSNAFTVFQPYVIKANGFTNTQGSSIITIRNLTSLCIVFFIGRIYDNISLRHGITFSVFLAAFSFMLYGSAHSFLVYCLAAGLSGLAITLGGMIPASVLLISWFKDHRALAMGICAAGTGMASTIAPPLVTKIIENFSLAVAFYVIVGIELFCAVIIYCLVRDKPEDMGLEIFTAGKSTEQAKSIGKRKISKTVQLSKHQLYRMMLAMFLIGTAINTAYGHYAVLYKTEGYDSMTVALALSFFGAVLIAGKCLCGQVMDWIGAYRTNFIFCGMLVIGIALCGLAPTHSTIILILAMLLTGLGFPVTTVGLSVWAADLSTPETYTTTLKNLQMASMVGTLAYSLVPGIVADSTGSYAPSYWAMALFIALCTFLVQKTYRECGKTK